MAINLGDRVKDRITGIKGIVIGRTEWIYGCLRLVLQPEEAKDGKPAESFSVDEPQVELIKAAVIQARQIEPERPETPARRHGPRNDAATARRSDSR